VTDPHSCVVLPLFAIACSNVAAPAPISNTPPPPSAPVTITASPCPADLVFHRETLVRGRTTEIARGGLTAIYHGATHDQYDDGATAMLLSLEVFGQPWLPDARDRTLRAFDRHCVRIASATEERVELEVAIQPAQEYDPARCHMGCCGPGESQAPDGTVECCFCSDEPAP
jgi:hypothetical protein